jgi:ABC-type Fe3+-hydroxamate transport system substrate-binding protein
VAVILRDLGLAGRIVGRHGYDLLLDPAIPSCGDQSGLDYEALLRVRPTHVVMERGAAGPPDRLLRLAEEHGWLVRAYPMLSLADIRACVDDVADLFGVSSAAVDSRMDAAWSRRDGLFSGRVLLLAAVDPPAALGPGSFHHQILERLGGVPAVAAGNPYVTLDAEDVLRVSPDAVLLILPRAPRAPPRARAVTPNEVLALLGRVGRLDIPAVRDGRVALIEDPLAHTPSTAMIGLADEMARVLQGWARAGR